MAQQLQAEMAALQNGEEKYILNVTPFCELTWLAKGGSLVRTWLAKGGSLVRTRTEHLPQKPSRVLACSSSRSDSSRESTRLPSHTALARRLAPFHGKAASKPQDHTFWLT